MQGQAGFWDIDDRYGRLSAAGDPLEKLNAVVPWEVFRKPLAKADYCAGALTLTKTDTHLHPHSPNELPI